MNGGLDSILPARDIARISRLHEMLLKLNA